MADKASHVNLLTLVSIAVLAPGVLAQKDECSTVLKELSEYPPKSFTSVTVNFVNNLPTTVELRMVPYDHECCRDKVFSYKNISGGQSYKRMTYPGNKWYALEIETGEATHISGVCIFLVQRRGNQNAYIGQDEENIPRGGVDDNAGDSNEASATTESNVANNGTDTGGGGGNEALYAIPVAGIILIMMGCAFYRVVKQRRREKAKQEALNPKPPKIGAKPPKIGAPPPKEPEKKKAGKTRSGAKGARAAARNRSKQAARQSKEP